MDIYILVPFYLLQFILHFMEDFYTYGSIILSTCHNHVPIKFSLVLNDVYNASGRLYYL